MDPITDFVAGIHKNVICYLSKTHKSKKNYLT